jgi:hypothetical protein
LIKIYCANSTRKIHISNNFILSVSFLIMFGTLLLRPSLHCNTPLHFTALHPTTLHYTSLHFTTLRYTSPNYASLHFTTLHHTSPNYISPHFTTLHPTTLHCTYRHFTSFHLHLITLSFSLTHLHFPSFYFTSHHITRHSTDLIHKLISKIINPVTALKNFSPFCFTSLFILFYS